MPTVILKLALKYLPQIIVIVVITLGALYVNGLINDVDRLTQSVEDRDQKINALNGSVNALTKENELKLKQLKAIRDHSAQVQADAIRMADEYKGRKTSLQAEINELYNRLVEQGKNPDETIPNDPCTLSTMPDNIIRLLKRPTPDDHDRESGASQDSATSTPN